jgi:hypothetical protein
MPAVIDMSTTLCISSAEKYKNIFPLAVVVVVLA